MFDYMVGVGRIERSGEQDGFELRGCPGALLQFPDDARAALLSAIISQCANADTADDFARCQIYPLIKFREAMSDSQCEWPIEADLAKAFAEYHASTNSLERLQWSRRANIEKAPPGLVGPATRIVDARIELAVKWHKHATRSIDKDGPAKGATEIPPGMHIRAGGPDARSVVDFMEALKGMPRGKQLTAGEVRKGLGKSHVPSFLNRYIAKSKTKRLDMLIPIDRASGKHGVKLRFTRENVIRFIAAKWLKTSKTELVELGVLRASDEWTVS